MLLRPKLQKRYRLRSTKWNINCEVDQAGATHVTTTIAESGKHWRDVTASHTRNFFNLPPKIAVRFLSYSLHNSHQQCETFSRSLLVFVGHSFIIIILLLFFFLFHLRLVNVWMEIFLRFLPSCALCVCLFACLMMMRSKQKGEEHEINKKSFFSCEVQKFQSHEVREIPKQSTAFGLRLCVLTQLWTLCKQHCFEEISISWHQHWSIERSLNFFDIESETLAAGNFGLLRKLFIDDMRSLTKSLIVTDIPAWFQHRLMISVTSKLSNITVDSSKSHKSLKSRTDREFPHISPIGISWCFSTSVGCASASLTLPTAYSPPPSPLPPTYIFFQFF